MVGRFFKDSALYGLATILAKGLTVLLVPVYTACLAAGEIGLLDLLLGAVAVLSLLIGLDMSNGLAREYAETADAEHRRRYSSTCLWFTAAAFGAALAIAWTVARPVAIAFLGGPEATGAIRAAAVCMAVNGVYVVAVQQLRWMMRPGRFGMVSVVTTAASLGATILFTAWWRLGAAGVLYGTAVGSGVGLVLTMAAAGGEFALRFDGNCLRRMLAFCIPIVPSSLAVIVNQYIARYVIEADLGRDAVGVFGVATRLAGLAGLVMLGFGSALTPLVYARQDDPETPSHLARIFRLFAAMAAVGLAGLAIFTPEILRLLTRADYSAAGPLMAWLAPSFLLLQMYIFAPGAWIRRRMWWVAGTNVVVACVTVLLNIALVPKAGLAGAAAATLLGGLLHFWLSMAVSQRLYPVPHRWGRIAAVVFVGAAGVVAGCLLPPTLSPALFAVRCALSGVVAAAVLAIDPAAREALRALALRFRGGGDANSAPV